MLDREQVIVVLELYRTSIECYLSDQLIDDIITLLKEQKPIKPLKHNDDYSQYWQCGHCFEPLITVSNYCHKCGRKVQWDD